MQSKLDSAGNIEKELRDQLHLTTIRNQNKESTKTIDENVLQVTDELSNSEPPEMMEQSAVSFFLVKDLTPFYIVFRAIKRVVAIINNVRTLNIFTMFYF